MPTYFISDLHLKPEQPAVGAAFMRFLEHQVPSADKLYILGDLFEYWVGDDAIDELGARAIINSMRAASRQTDCFFIAGNRDFLVRDGFASASGFTILADETVIDLYGSPTLLLHGDSLCTDDHKHQEFRANFVTNHLVCELLLARPRKERLALAVQARNLSQTNKDDVQMDIMDVTDSAVAHAFEKYDVRQMIHGHTHRQGIHQSTLDGHRRQRVVLGDWHTQNSILRVDELGMTFSNHDIY